MTPTMTSLLITLHCFHIDPESKAQAALYKKIITT